MEVSGVLCQKKACLSLSLPLPCRRRRRISLVPHSIDLSDKSHLTYYYYNPKSHVVASSKTLKSFAKNKIKKTSIDGLSTKQKLKLLNSFAHSSHHLSLEDAAAAFLNEVEQVRAEEKQQKIKKRDKAKRTMNDSSCESSSSSSSESESESESEIDMRETQQEEEEEEEEDGVGVTAEEQRKRVEVCMGNKCNKSGGAAALLAEFQRQMGPNANAVVACKCMGKCKSAPNLRVTLCNDNESSSESVRISNPLYIGIGVGLEDVSSIIATFFGDGDGQQHFHNNAFLQPPLPASP